MLTDSIWNREVSPLHPLKMAAWELEGSALMIGHIPTCFPVLGNGSVPYIFHTYRKGSHACFVGKCISIAKASSSYLLSAPAIHRTHIPHSHPFSLSCTWFFWEALRLWSWIALSLIDQLLCRSHVGARPEVKDLAGQWVQQILMAVPLVRARQVKEGASFTFSYCPMGTSQICCSVQDQRKFQTRSHLGPTVFLSPCRLLGGIWEMKADMPSPT